MPPINPPADRLKHTLDMMVHIADIARTAILAVPTYATADYYLKQIEEAMTQVDSLWEEEPHAEQAALGQAGIATHPAGY